MMKTIFSVFLLLLAVAGNFIPETLGCKTQDLLNNSMVAKHVILVVILYLTINFQNSSDSNPGIVATQAKNLRMRQCGCSAYQWTFGKDQAPIEFSKTGDKGLGSPWLC